MNNRTDQSSSTASGRRRTLTELARSVARRGTRMLFLIRVYVLLIAMRGVIRVLSLESITARLGTPMFETARDDVSEDQIRYARRVGWAVGRAAPLTPTDSNCYPQALTAWWLLHRKEISTTFYYGAAFDEDGTALEGHVWLRCGPVIVTGDGGHRRRFAPLTWYGD